MSQRLLRIFWGIIWAVSVGLLMSAAALAQNKPAAAPDAPKSPPAKAEEAAAAPAPAGAAPAGEDKPAPSEAEKEEARRQFQKGLVLLREEAWSAALAAFLRSREVFPTRGNTNNAAVCLRKLQRYDEAIDMFELLLRDFPNLPAADKLDAQRNIAELRELVGTIDISGAVPGAAITVDGQARGDFPPVTPIRASAGSHLVRVYKEGYEPFEVRVDIAGGQSARVVAKLRPLRDSGRLRVVEQSGRSLDVVIDGTVRGQTPWEGKLELGPHMVLLRGRGIVGTQPASVVVRSQQTESLSLRAEELNAAIRIEPRPVSAQVEIDGVTLGKGPWALRLKAGRHRVEVSEEGFLSETRDVVLSSGDRQIVVVELGRDPSAARWQNPSKWTLELGTGFAVVPSLGGDIAGGCSGDCSRGFGFGGMALAQGGYELGWGLGFSLAAGYFVAVQSVDKRDASITPVGLSARPGTLDDSLRIDGPVVGATVSYRFGDRFPVGIRLGAGALISRVRDERSGAFTARDETLFQSDAVASRASATFGYAAPEIYFGARLGRKLELGGSLAGLLLFAASQPRWDSSIETSAGSDGRGTYAPEVLTGAFVLSIIPSVRLRYEL
jgi:hypothetical protein